MDDGLDDLTELDFKAEALFEGLANRDVLLAEAEARTTRLLDAERTAAEEDCCLTLLLGATYALLAGRMFLLLDAGLTELLGLLELQSPNSS